MNDQEYLTHGFKHRVVFSPKNYENFTVYDLYIAGKCIAASLTLSEKHNLIKILRLNERTNKKN